MKGLMELGSSPKRSQSYSGVGSPEWAYSAWYLKDCKTTVNCCCDEEMLLTSEVLLCLCLLSHVQLFTTPRTIAHHVPLSMGILQARILEWVAMPSSRGSSQPRHQIQISHIVGGFLTIWATKEPMNTGLSSLSLFQWIFLTQELN